MCDFFKDTKYMTVLVVTSALFCFIMGYKSCSDHQQKLDNYKLVLNTPLLTDRMSLSCVDKYISTNNSCDYVENYFCHIFETDNPFIMDKIVITDTLNGYAKFYRLRCKDYTNPTRFYTGEIDEIKEILINQ